MSQALAAPALRGAWLGWRDRLLASPRFQRWASAFFLTRPLARRRASELFDLCAGFVYSQVLLACVRLDLLQALASGPRSVIDLAAATDLPEASMDRLLRAATALGLASRRGPDYALGERGAALLGNPGVLAMVRHHALFYADLADPVALLRGEMGETALNRFWGYAGHERPAALADARVAEYSGLMAASQDFIADDVLDAYPFHRHRRLLDVGGGEGAFLEKAGQRCPQLELRLFDLPAVAERARARLARAGLSRRAEVAGGDFFRDTLPQGADLVSLVRIIHDHGDDQALAILTAARRALEPDGTLVLAEPVADERGNGPMADAYFGFYLMAMGSGRPRSRAALAELITRAGFSGIRRHTTHRPLLVSVLSASAI
ncbi:MAG: methyltransferase [Geminicoccaceae bacterium]